MKRKNTQPRLVFGTVLDKTVCSESSRESDWTQATFTRRRRQRRMQRRAVSTATSVALVVAVATVAFSSSLSTNTITLAFTATTTTTTITTTILAKPHGRGKNEGGSRFSTSSVDNESTGLGNEFQCTRNKDDDAASSSFYLSSPSFTASKQRFQCFNFNVQQKLYRIESILLNELQWTEVNLEPIWHSLSPVAVPQMEGLTDFLMTFLDIAITTSTFTTTEARRTREENNNSDPFRFIGVVHSERIQQQKQTPSTPFVTREILLAGIRHYVDCIVFYGVGDLANQGIDSRNSLFPWINNVPCLPPAFADLDSSVSQPKKAATIRVSTALTTRTMTVVGLTVKEESDVQTNLSVESSIDSGRISKAISRVSNDHQYGVNHRTVEMIVRCAANSQRLEQLARQCIVDRDTVLSYKEAATMRELILTGDEFDWRSLMLRCVACLSRLEKIVGNSHYYGYVDDDTDVLFVRTREAVIDAREGMRVYATLAQQLGLERLKARIEHCSFQILHRRQYKAVAALYANTPLQTTTDEKNKSKTSMESISSLLQIKFAKMLFEDEALMAQLESLQISARVKERFSLWKKLVKKKFKEINQRKAEMDVCELSANDVPTNEMYPNHESGIDKLLNTSLTTASSNLSVSDVKDAIALRVVLRSRKWHASEPEETTRAREQLLCYYIREKLRSHWPAVEPKRIKDYIQYPKANGYQSLHYTSVANEVGTSFPFEVQVRSDEMHEMAEYGMANHWAYKLGYHNEQTTARTTRLLLDSSSALEEGQHLQFDTDIVNRSNANTYLDSLETTCGQKSAAV